MSPFTDRKQTENWMTRLSLLYLHIVFPAEFSNPPKAKVSMLRFVLFKCYEILHMRTQLSCTCRICLRLMCGIWTLSLSSLLSTQYQQISCFTSKQRLFLNSAASRNILKSLKLYLKSNKSSVYFLLLSDILQLHSSFERVEYELVRSAPTVFSHIIAHGRKSLRPTTQWGESYIDTHCVPYHHHTTRPTHSVHIDSATSSHLRMCRAVTLKARSVQEAHKNFEKHFLLMIDQGFFDILFINTVKLAEYAYFYSNA